ncbi:carbohydrate ABC transporter permease [Microlunatus elymi]|uniref:Carbohydrate ABC transporter permease n=1 Tax=Microlunatus elymi TaxID=2596828 RepID=A0A516PW13_9ACTN|nr:carbohydrate ABC transporter permease [Microlunatus elymi]QDP95374.1 carbohydrate ABC transporter permease [Microlunatus elymi]
MSGYQAEEKTYRGVNGAADRARKGGSYALLLVGAATFLLPFAWMLSTSLKTPDEIYAYPIKWIPKHPQWHTYADLFADGSFLRYILNTILITVLGVTFSLVGSSFAAYAFARLRFPGRDAMFFVMLATIMVPAWATVIPSYVMFGLLGWLDTYLPILVPALFATPFNTFLLRQFFLSIPRELEDAAKVDGAGTLRCFVTIVLPLAKPALIIVALFAFLFYWNEFLGPLIYLSSQDKFPISLGIMNFAGEKSQDFASMMAAATVAMAPCVVLFFIAQRWFVQGVVITGVKG